LNLGFLARVLWERRVLRGRERWSRDAIAAHQGAAFTELRRFASDLSPILFLTMMFGPIGLLAFLAMRRRLVQAQA